MAGEGSLNVLATMPDASKTEINNAYRLAAEWPGAAALYGTGVEFQASAAPNGVNLGFTPDPKDTYAGRLIVDLANYIRGDAEPPDPINYLL